MSRVEGILLWLAIGLYVAAFAAALAGAAFRCDRLHRIARLVFWPALAAHLGAGIARWLATGHAPVMYAYENSLTGSFVLGLIFAVLALRVPATRKALPLVAAAVLLLLGNGITAPHQLTPLEPPFRSGWLAVHVTFAWLAFGAYLVASIIAAIYLVAARRKAADEAATRRADLLDDVSGRLIAFGFAADTVMIASGAIWAHGLWGRYWGWDPIETWSLVSWLIYGVNLHLRFTLGWRGRRAAWLAVASVVGIVITFFGVGVVSDVHSELL